VTSLRNASIPQEINCYGRFFKQKGVGIILIKGRLVTRTFLVVSGTTTAVVVVPVTTTTAVLLLHASSSSSPVSVSVCPQSVLSHRTRQNFVSFIDTVSASLCCAFCACVFRRVCVWHCLHCQQSVQWQLRGLWTRSHCRGLLLAILMELCDCLT